MPASASILGIGKAPLRRTLQHCEFLPEKLSMRGRKNRDQFLEHARSRRTIWMLSQPNWRISVTARWTKSSQSGVR